MNIDNKSDLENLIINQIEENLNLDYKASGSLGKSDGKKDEISRDVSSFANSNGGTIIYGIAEFNEKEKSHLPEKIDGINRVEYPKEWLENIINGRISPRIEGIEIKSISVNNTNTVVYVVEIPKSTTAHQASDFRYYKRSNFGKNPMYDYEVKDIMNRNKSPKIELIMEIEKYEYEVKPPIGQITLQLNREKEPLPKEYAFINTLNVYAKNVGAIYADYVNCFLEIPISILQDGEYDHRTSIFKNGIEYKRLFCDNTIREIRDIKNYGMFNTYDYWPSRYDPILPETQLRLDEIKFKKEIAIESEVIFWEIYADNALKSIGEIKISELDIVHKEASK